MRELTLKDTSVLKGFALLLLLIHHLFYVQRGLYDDIVIANHGIVEYIGKASKLCVAIFVYLSGYGLMAGAMSRGKINAGQFYLTRLTKLMLNFWLIYLLFVPVNAICFGNGFSEVYNDGIIAGITDFMGLSFMFYGHEYTMNPTWWFYSLIIVLYLLFPIIFKYGKTTKRVLFLSGVALCVALLPIPLGYMSGVKGYLLIFVNGGGVIYC